jgi:hypothetical protein
MPPFSEGGMLESWESREQVEEDQSDSVGASSSSEKTST